MNNVNTPKSNIIVPLFLLSGLLTIIGGCSSTEPRPEVIEIAEPVVTQSAEMAPVAKKEIRVKTSYPKQYTVKKGDTLWDISGLFLRDPWYWPEIWQDNSQIKNPHLIYPGDVLTLVYVDGQPRMLVNDAQHRAIAQAANGRVKKLSPTVRTTELAASIPTIPGDAIRQFLTKPRVVTKEQLANAPHIVGSQDNHLILGTGNRVYIRGEIDKERVRFSIFNPGDALHDPVTNELLGYEAKYAGDVHITSYDDPASGDITYTEREILIGDRLLNEDRSKRENQYFPHVPEKDIEGQILSLYDAIFGVAQYQIVVINKGERDGVEVGHILATFSQGDTVRDRHGARGSQKVKLPNERSGLVMIFKTFERVSYALTMESERVIHKNDVVTKPRF